MIKMVKTPWSELVNGDIVYIRGQFSRSGPCFYGPHQVFDTETRCLRNVGGKEHLYYPDDLYKEEDSMRYDEIHQTGHITVEKNMESVIEGDIGIQISADGRIWVCINGQAAIRFTPHI